MRRHEFIARLGCGYCYAVRGVRAVVVERLHARLASSSPKPITFVQYFAR